jgi:hypothetical protein
MSCDSLHTFIDTLVGHRDQLREPALRIRHYDVTVVVSTEQVHELTRWLSPDAILASFCAAVSSSAEKSPVAVAAIDSEAQLDRGDSIGAFDVETIGVVVLKQEIKKALQTIWATSRTSGPEAAAVSTSADTLSPLVLGTPLNYQLWNERKRNFHSCDTADVGAYRRAATRELNAVSLVLAWHPKAAEAWDHRRWIIQTVAPVIAANAEATRWLASALSADAYVTVPQALRRHPRNYYAWQYRQTVVMPLLVQGATIADRCRIVAEDLIWLLEHYRRNIHEASAVHYIGVALSQLRALRPQALGDMSDDTDDVAARAVGEAWRTSQRVLRATCPALGGGTLGDAAHESVWLLRRAVVQFASRFNRHDESLVGQWTLSDELALVSLHTDDAMTIIAARSDGGMPEATLRSHATLPHFWPVYAARYGRWLCAWAAERY